MSAADPPRAPRDPFPALPTLPMFETLDWFEAKGRVRDGWVPYGGGVLPSLRVALDPLGIECRDLRLDRDLYARFVADAGYARRPEYSGSRQVEKKLEHFALAVLLKLRPDDVYIDVASSDSPVPQIYEALYGCRAFAQDLLYPEGVQGNRIGGDASRMPVAANFASKLALHCAFEHFEEDSDVRFLREVERVLRPGGRCCILPLYIAEEYAIQTDPAIAGPEGVRFETDAILYRAAGWGQGHGRFYSPERLRSRLLAHLEGLTASVVHFVNEKEFDPQCYLKFALLLEKPA